MGRAYNPTHLCSLCGQPTRSKYPVCGRHNECQAEYVRLAQAEGRKTEAAKERQRRYLQGDTFKEHAKTDEYREHRNSATRRHRQNQKGEPSVYAVWLPSPQILKVGFTIHTNNSIFVSVARTRGGARGFDTTGISCIWRKPGDTRAESWIQATLAFRWRPAYEQKHNRICEWFGVSGLAAEGVIETLDEVYGLMPPDLIQRADHEVEAERLPPVGMPITLW